MSDNRTLELNIESLVFEVENLKSRINSIEELIEQAQEKGIDKIVINTPNEALEQFKGTTGRPPKYYHIIKDYYLKGYSYNRIADITGASPSTVAKTVRKLKSEGITRE